jgi:uncharacterized membrane protein YbhN (UPF0104 family)
MKNILKKSFFYLLSVALIFYIIYSIGISNIYKAFASVNIYIIALAIFISILATLIRIYKFKLLLRNKDWQAILEIFITSRLGKEVSFAGYFVPLIKKNNRNDGTFQNLVIDRYTEILSTLLIALISCFFALKNSYLESIIFITIGIFTLFLTLVPFVKIPRLGSYAVLVKLTQTAQNLKERLSLNSRYISKIHILSILATLLDFLTALIVFKAFGTDVNFMIISIIWASSGLVSILTFMIIGSTEISVIYLYNILAGINKAVTASFVIISRIINVLVLGIIFLYYALLFKKKHSVIPISEPND